MGDKMKKSKKIKQYSGQDIMFNIFNYTFFALFTIVCAYPFYYLIINTISANDLSANGFIRFLPKNIHFNNYFQVLKLNGLSRAAMISIARTLIGTVCTVMSSAFLGYLYSQQDMWKRKIWYRLMVVTMYFNAGLIPMYLTMKNLHLRDSFWVYIIPAIVQPFYIILVKTYIESTPASLQEAAEIDGAGILTTFFRIIFPLSKPILATITIFSAVGQWNSFGDTLIYITNQKLYSLQYLLFVYINQANSLAQLVKTNTSGSVNVQSLITQQTPTSIRMTVSIIVVLPILFIYPIFQRYFIKGIMMGSVKG